MSIFFNQYNKFRSGVYVYVLLIASIVIIFMTGLISYNKISHSLSNLNNRFNEDFELRSIKDIRLDYAKLDNMMEMYLITHQQFYITQLDSTAEGTRQMIAKLKTSKKISRYEVRHIDSLKLLLNNKIRNLKYISLFQQDASIERLINDYMNMQSLRSAMDRATELKAQKSAKPKTPVPVKKKKTNKHKDSLKAEELINIEKQDVFNISDTNRVNPYLKRDYGINAKFNDLCRMIENIETDRLEQERKNSEKAIKETSQYTLYVYLLLMLFLILACIVYFKYLRKSADLTKSLSDSKEIAEEMTIIKERFMANMSHEIRTPLNAISGFVDQLHQSNINSRQKKQTEIIQKSIQHILNIINDILDFSKLNAGKLTLTKSGFEIGALVNQTIESLETLVEEKHIHMSCVIDPQVPGILIGDAYRLKQILLNIIGNAIKYTNKGTIRVHVSSKKTGDNLYLVDIQVKDSGIGIDKNDLDNIFKEFHMAENARWTKSGSTGLGLSITKMLVELYNGKIEIDSKINEGTSVSISIPFESGSEQDLSVEDQYLNYLNFLKGKHILIADDEPFNRILMNNILQKYSAFTTEAENGTQVLSLLQTNTFDCILMDLKMPEINGTETSRQIRSSENKDIAHIPIIAVSAAITNENFEKLKALGVNFFLEKPFKENVLLNLLYKIFGKGNEDVVIHLPGKVENNLKPDKMFDLSELQRQAGNDRNFTRDMIKTLIESTQKGIQEIEQYIADENWEKIHLTSHRIASPLKFIFARESYDIIKQMEHETGPDNEPDKENIRYNFDKFVEKFKKLEQLLQEYVENQLG